MPGEKEFFTKRASTNTLAQEWSNPGKFSLYNGNKITVKLIIILLTHKLLVPMKLALRDIMKWSCNRKRLWLQQEQRGCCSRAWIWTFNSYNVISKEEMRLQAPLHLFSTTVPINQEWGTFGTISGQSGQGWWGVPHLGGEVLPAQPSTPLTGWPNGCRALQKTETSSFPSPVPCALLTGHCEEKLHCRKTSGSLSQTIVSQCNKHQKRVTETPLPSTLWD